MAGYFNFMNQGIVCCIILTSFSAVEDRHLNFSSITKELLLSSYQESLQMLDKALFHSSQRHNTAMSVVHMMSTFPRQAEPDTQEISRAAEVFTTTLQVLKDRTSLRYKRDTTASELLSWEDVELIAELSGCPPATHHAMCLQQHHVNKYRSISGLCNNRLNPLWGASNTPLNRWLPAEYEDGETQPKGWNHGRLHNGFQLPLAREVSRNIVKSSHKHKDSMYSQMLVEWGQYIDHDMTFTPQSISKAAFKGGADCWSTCENVHPCFPIQTCGVLSGDKTCMPFFRSSAACPTSVVSDIKGALQRQQMNAITSFIDASVVYGHTPKLQRSLRELSGTDGRLAVNHQFKDPNDRAYLPFVRGVPSACHQAPGSGGGTGTGTWSGTGTPRRRPRVECFRAGDSRVNEALGLVALHTLWLREHNRVAAALTRLNAHWSAETTYQETRKIIGALHQIITMRDYVPKIIGLKSLEEYIAPYRGYDPTVDPSASNVFATAAFRFGHATINPVLRRLNESFQEDQRFPSLNLEHTFFSPWRIVQQGGIEPVLRGVMGTAAAAMSPEQLMSEEVTERLLLLDAPHKMDLASLNLQRGRDHALPGYNAWRAFCGLKRIDTQEDFQGVVKDARVVEEIMKLYKHPDNIDVWLGGLVEDLLPGSRTGPLFACLIGKQMKVLRDGDRFWWEAEGVFTEHQRAELSKWSLSRIICDNSDMREVPRDAFRLGRFPADLLPCHRIPSINLDAWREDSTTGNQD